MNKRILVVDDEKNIRLMLTQCLRDQEYEVNIAVNGEEGLDAIRENRYDLVLLDIKMPGLTGMQVLEKIREEGNRVNVIMMTAYGTIEKAVEAMKLGAIDFVSKPFTPEEVRELVKSVLDRQMLDEKELATFEDFIQYAKKCLQEREYCKAEKYLKQSIAADVDAPEPHNLLGVLFEYRGDLYRAGNHYRAALSLDPAYEPAQHNLSRLTQYTYSKKNIDLGVEDDDVSEK